MKVFQDKLFCSLVILGTISGIIASEPHANRAISTFPHEIVGYACEADDPLYHCEKADNLMNYRDPKVQCRHRSDLLESIRECDLAIKLKPDCSYAYVLRGFANHYLNNIEESKKNFDQAIKLDPSDARKYNAKSLCCSDRIEDYNKAVSLDPKCPFFRETRGSWKLRNKDFLGSFLDYAESIRLDIRSVSSCVESIEYCLKYRSKSSEHRYFIIEG